MKNLLLVIAGLSVLASSACGSSAASIATQNAATEAARPTVTETLTLAPTATVTLTPSPTSTQTPTITPTPTIALEAAVPQTYEDVEVIKQDNFDQYLSGFAPIGWNADQQKVSMGSEPFLQLNWLNSVIYYSEQALSPNTAVVVRFKFIPKSIFDMGIDCSDNGRRIPYSQPGYCSVTLEFREIPLILYNWETGGKASRTSYYLEGDLKLKADTWYMYTLGMLEKRQFIVRIWDPEDSSKMLTFQKRFEDMAEEAYFIMWLNNKAVLSLDDFTIIRFSGLQNDE